MSVRPKPLGVVHSDPGFVLPPGSCDCHVHVFEPDRFPLAPRRTYQPATATVDDLKQFLAVLRLDRVVLVQPSPYDTDNRLLLEALGILGNRARAVVAIDEGVSAADIAAMHAAGARGTRLNLETFGQTDPGGVEKLLRDTARRVADHGWHVQIHARLPLIAAIAPVLADLPTPVVIDHFGYASPNLETEQQERAALLRLLETGEVYLKLSAAHRIGPPDEGVAARELARVLIEANPNRLLWGSDWPHTAAWPGRPRHPDEIEPFHPIDDGLALRRLAHWTSAEERYRILMLNPTRLYDFGETS